MNKSQRIYLSDGDNSYIKIRLEQDVDTFEFMSLKISADDVYQDFNADYGVLVGRVIGNGAIGIPNAKVSIFIPITQEDETNGEITSVYPYKTPRDKNNEGKRYNLLPRVPRINYDTKQPEPPQAFGSFPLKEEMFTNETLLGVYKKYYKYTATTNDAGDYMIFGVPIGTQTVHMSVDITDIGKYSIKPAAMVTNLGYAEANFTDNNTKIKPSSDLDDLPHIETQEIDVDVIPFWGDVENFEIGITRQDFRIRATLVNTFVVFGSAFTDSAETLRGWDYSQQKEIRDLFYTVPNNNKDSNDNSYYGVSIGTKRAGQITEKVFYYPANVDENDITSGNVEDDGSDMRLLNDADYTKYKRDGDFVFIINCNREKIITNEYGEEVSVPHDHSDGIFTSFRGFMTVEITETDAPMVGESDLNSDKTKILPYRIKLKIPQYVGSGGETFYMDRIPENAAWRKQHQKFLSGKYYSITKYNPTIYNIEGTDRHQFDGNHKVTYDNYGFFQEDIMMHAEAGSGDLSDFFSNIGTIVTSDASGISNYQMEMQPNVVSGSYPLKRFGANWLNLAVYLPQLGYLVTSDKNHVRGVLTTDFFHVQRDGYHNSDWGDANKYFLYDNDMDIAAGIKNTKWFARSDIHQIHFIEVPFDDIVYLNNQSTKGFRLSSGNVNINLDGSYKNGEDYCIYQGGRLDGDPNNSTDTYTYFFKGLGSADCLGFLYELGIIE